MAQPFQIVLSIRCPVRRVQTVPSRKTCTMICMVDVWSCALGVRGQSVGLGHERSSTVHFRHRVPSPCPSCPRRLSRRFTQCHSHRCSHSTHCRTLGGLHNTAQNVVLRFQFAWTCLPRSLLLPSKNWFAAVVRNSFHCSLTSAT